MSYLVRLLQVKLLGRRNVLQRLGGAVLAGLAALLWGGCGSAPATPAPAGPKAAPTADVKVDDAWTDAKLVAAREPGSQAVVGRGASMQPVYGDNTMLVIRPIPYDELRPGMTVAYTNRQGQRVVHKLVVKLADGWRVMGLNNDRVDNEVVTPKNLVGVIYASFNYEGDEPPPPTPAKP